MSYCTKCGKETGASDSFCCFCGQSLSLKSSAISAPETQSNLTIKIAIGACVGILAAAVIYGIFSGLFSALSGENSWVVIMGLLVLVLLIVFRVIKIK